MEEAKEETLRQIKELQMLPGWNKLQERLAKHLMRNEKVKAERLRLGEFNQALYRQGLIDGIKTPLSELDKMLRDLSPDDEN